MSFCSNCGKEINEGAAFCESCGAPASSSGLIAEEQKFLDQTYRFLRWERTAWKVCGIVLVVLGIVFAVLFGLMALVGALGIDSVGGDGVPLIIVGVIYGVIFGGMFLALGIVGLVSAKKISQYLDSMYTNFRLTLERCGSIGMLVFTALFSTIALIFFLINFVRIKSNRRVIDRILARQGK